MIFNYIKDTHNPKKPKKDLRCDVHLNLHLYMSQGHITFVLISKRENQAVKKQKILRQKNKNLFEKGICTLKF